MPIHPLAGQAAPASMLIDVPALVRAFYDDSPTRRSPPQRVSFGTSGHRGTRSSARSTKTTSSPSPRPLANTAGEQGITGPVFVGIDTHALSDAGAGHGLGSPRGTRRPRPAFSPRADSPPPPR